MKLITETILDQAIINELNEAGQKEWYIQGIFAQSEVVNNNNRSYPKDILLREILKYKAEKVDTNRAMGELNHPQSPTVDLERVTHRTVELEEQGNDFVGKALVLNTPMGQIIKGIMEGGGQIAISSRALGSIKNVKGTNVVGKDLMLKTFDIVSDPGAPSAFMDGIMEGVEYKFMGDQLVAEKIDNVIKEVRTTSSANINQALIGGYAQILNIAKGIK